MSEFIVMHSKDDSSIEYEQAIEIAQNLDAELITFEDRDHFDNPQNAATVLKVLRDKLNF